MSILFDEAIQALNKVKLLTDIEGNKVMDLFIQSFPFNTEGVGKIDWDNIDKKICLKYIEEVKNLKDFDLNKKCYIIWNDNSFPILETVINNAINAFEDVAAVNFDTWIFIPENKMVIENRPSGLIISLPY